LWGHALLLLVIWVGVKALLAWAFRENAGTLYEFHLVDHNLRLPLVAPFKFVTFVSFHASLTILILCPPQSSLYSLSH